MMSKIDFYRMMIVISFIFLFLGFFTPLPFYIFSSAGAIGITVNWLLLMGRNKKNEDEDVIDVRYKEVESEQLSFDEKIRKLEELRIDSLITEEEYEKKRKQIMKEKW